MAKIQLQVYGEQSESLFPREHFLQYSSTEKKYLTVKTADAYGHNFCSIDLFYPLVNMLEMQYFKRFKLYIVR